MGSFFNFFKRISNEKESFKNIKKEFTRNGELIYPGELLKIASKKFAKKVALVCDENKITYEEFYFRSVLLSKKLKDMGLESGDKVILYSGNSIDFHIAYFAIWQIGAIVVPINIFLHDKELLYVIKNCEAKAIFVSDEFKEKIEKLKKEEELKNVKNIFSNDDIDWISDIEKIDFEVTCLKPEELCVLLYTSGTTGKPKGVMLSCNNVMINTLQDYARLMHTDKRKNESFFSVLPLFHVFAQNTCLWLPVLTGSKIIIVKKIDRKLILKGLEKKPTLFFGFPALYGLLCLLKTAPLDSIRMFISGADAMPDKIRMAFSLIYGRKICAGYGLTEAAPVVAVNHENESLATQFVGYPLQGLECDIRDEQQNSLPIGKIGTLWIKGDNVMMGYYKSPEETQKVLKDGWLNTGDLGYKNEKGYLAISGRSKDLIIHKGFNIYPQEIENILLSHPAVYQAAVIGRQDSSTGQIPVAYVGFKGENKNLEKILRDLCAANLATYKIPKKFFCLEKLPMNATGKIDKKRLQQI
ncbi:AMP-binding protein [Candidatus Dependentiae bacterium]|nr:AMP-binding protein [Candidatus Dependentiae bacterium]